MTVQNLYQTYRELVRDIHLAVSSGDLVALQGIQGMLERRAELEEILDIDGSMAAKIHDGVATEIGY